MLGDRFNVKYCLTMKGSLHVMEKYFHKKVCSNPLISFLSFRAGYPCTSMLTGLHYVWQLRLFKIKGLLCCSFCHMFDERVQGYIMLLLELLRTREAMSHQISMFEVLPRKQLSNKIFMHRLKS
ncbi:uncharacterized protein LOC110882297 [Helianthus annuus]|uniref:uncharacterized protein LOC110882297 n=1 Tax=Helianthus annuus TaxID=4232 RepID=UPI0016533E0B|nr:uncharacterized protein LOC110882297 [Helianthus annuus]